MVVGSSSILSDESGKSSKRNGTLVEFTPDREIFGDFTFREEFLQDRCQHYAHLNAGLRIQMNGMDFISEDGLMDLLLDEAGESAMYPLIFFRDKTLEFALTHTSDFGERYLSFANGQYTSSGGTHLSAFKEGITKGINSFAGESYSSQDVREGIIAAVSIRIKEPIFESQTKTRLGNNDIRGWIVNTVKTELEKHLHKNPESASILVSKVKINQKVRTELSDVKKKAKQQKC